MLFIKGCLVSRELRDVKFGNLYNYDLNIPNNALSSSQLEPGLDGSGTFVVTPVDSAYRIRV
jgi:hypothetical protein